MPEPDRFNDEQVREILRLASTESETDEHATALQPPSQQGLTLAELQSIAAEVGVSADAVTRAAASVARGDHQPAVRQTLIGLPVGVARTIELSRVVTDHEWDRIVLELQELFAARGKQHVQGRMREWQNGNLRAVLEPTPEGSRLRLSTRRGDARQFLTLGVTAIGIGAGLGLLNLLAGGNIGFGGGAALMGMGALALARNFFVLPAWARERTRQMEELGPRIERLLQGNG